MRMRMWLGLGVMLGMSASGLGCGGGSTPPTTDASTSGDAGVSSDAATANPVTIRLTYKGAVLPLQVPVVFGNANGDVLETVQTGATTGEAQATVPEGSMATAVVTNPAASGPTHIMLTVTDLKPGDTVTGDVGISMGDAEFGELEIWAPKPTDTTGITSWSFVNGCDMKEGEADVGGNAIRTKTDQLLSLRQSCLSADGKFTIIAIGMESLTGGDTRPKKFLVQKEISKNSISFDRQGKAVINLLTAPYSKTAADWKEGVGLYGIDVVDDGMLPEIKQVKVDSRLIFGTLSFSGPETERDEFPASTTVFYPTDQGLALIPEAIDVRAMVEWPTNQDGEFSVSLWGKRVLPSTFYNEEHDYSETFHAAPPTGLLPNSAASGNMPTVAVVDGRVAVNWTVPQGMPAAVDAAMVAFSWFTGDGDTRGAVWFVTAPPGMTAPQHLPLLPDNLGPTAPAQGMDMFVDVGYIDIGSVDGYDAYRTQHGLDQLAIFFTQGDAILKANTAETLRVSMAGSFSPQQK